MIMKNGSSVPQILAQALEGDMYALKVFFSMSASYQEMCVDRFLQSDEPSARKRVEGSLKDIHKYGELRGI